MVNSATHRLVDKELAKGTSTPSILDRLPEAHPSKAVRLEAKAETLGYKVAEQAGHVADVVGLRDPDLERSRYTRQPACTQSSDTTSGPLHTNSPLVHG